MRKKLICGNWKMYKTRQEAREFFSELSKLELASDVEVMIACSYTLLDTCVQATDTSAIAIAAQNVHEAPQGAFTGEVAITMLKDAKVVATLIGHSERRQYYGETDQKVAAKAVACLAAGILPIVCIGESLAEREAGSTFAVISTQLKDLFASVDNPGNIVIAYEPVWAIGTGKTASKEQAQEFHAYIREQWSARYGQESGASLRILYGGSVNPGNARDLLSQPDIDGALVGGASLKPADFAQIVNR